MLSVVIVLSLIGQPAPEIQLIAHRGGVVDDGRIENNLPAMEEAIRRGYWMLEVDVRRSRDGHPVVHHDADFKRYYNDARRVSDMTWSEIQQLRSQPDGLHPLDLSQVARVCQGRIRLMLDIKVMGDDRPLFAQIEQVLLKHELLSSAYLIGDEAAKKYFESRLKVSVDGQGLRDAIQKGEDVASRTFLFGVAAQFDAATVGLAQSHGVDVVPGVNAFRYDAEDTLPLAAADIGRLRKLGVVRFQIDSMYDPLFTPSK